MKRRATDANLSPQENLAIESFRSAMVHRYGSAIIELKLFGSRSRGESDEFSDVDVLVLVSERQAGMRGEIFGMAYDIFYNTDINISPLIMTRDEFRELSARERSLAKEIEKDGITI